MILTRVRPSVFLPGLALVWGTFAALMGATHNWSQLAGMRFLLGFAEVCPKMEYSVISNVYRPALHLDVRSSCRRGIGGMSWRPDMHFSIRLSL